MHSRELLIEASDHLHYEVWMLRLASYRLSEYSTQGLTSHTAVAHTTDVHVSEYSSDAPVTPPSQEEDLTARANSDLETFALHPRSLLGFFYMPAQKARPDDLLAEHFFPDPAIWRTARPQLSETDVKAIRDRVGKEIAHLTQHRLFLAAPDRLWAFLDLKAHALNAATAFVGTVDPQLLSDKWRSQSA